MQANMSQSVLQKNYNIPVHVTDLSTFDDSFPFMKARFQQEMSRVTEEMNKFSNNLSRLYQITAPHDPTGPQVQDQRTPKDPQTGLRILSGTTRPSETLTAQPNQPKPNADAKSLDLNLTLYPDEVTWAAISQSPLLVEEGDSKKLKLQFDVSQYDPAELLPPRGTVVHELVQLLTALSRVSVSHLAEVQRQRDTQTGPATKSTSTRTLHTPQSDKKGLLRAIQSFGQEAVASAQTYGLQLECDAIMESPLVSQNGDSLKMKLQFDVSQYAPSEVKVQFLDDMIYVKAKHDERTENSLVLREYSQQFMLPKGIDPETVVSSLSRDGVLTVEAPLPQFIVDLVKEAASHKKPEIKSPKNLPKETEPGTGANADTPSKPRPASAKSEKK